MLSKRIPTFSPSWTNTIVGLVIGLSVGLLLDFAVIAVFPAVKDFAISQWSNPWNWLLSGVLTLAVYLFDRHY